MALRRGIEKAQRKIRRAQAERRKDAKRDREGRRARSLTWDVAPLMVLASAGVALLQEPRKHKLRRAEPGRGRFAKSPHEIPKRGWKDILLRTKSEFAQDQVPMLAAGVTFFTLLALFPGLAAFVALYGLFADVSEAQHHLALLAYLLPPATLDFIGGEMIRLAEGNKGGQSFAFVAGLLLSLWSANGAMKAMMTGLNIAYEETETRGFLRRTATSLAFTVGLIAFAIAALALLAAGPAIETFVGQRAATIFGWISWPVLVVGLILGLALLHRFGPSRDPVRWKWISWGSAGVIVCWAAVSALFSLYVGNFTHYDKTYGPLGAAIGFMMWLYISNVVVLAGAELNAEIEHQTTVDTTTGAPEPMGLRRARMADTIGKAQGR
jgi:membrane protein